MKIRNLEYFIASRLSEKNSGSFVAQIIVIAQVVIGICLAVMIIGSSIINGFKSDITEKVFGFWGHIHITDSRATLNRDIVPISKDQTFYPDLEEVENIKFDDYNYDPPQEVQSKSGVKKIQSFIILPGIINTKTEMEGIFLKGIDDDYDWDFLTTYLKEGRLPDISDTLASRDILLSEQSSKRLGLKVGDDLIVHFVLEKQPLKRKFSVCGLYKTGLEEYDKKYAIIDIKILRDLLKWGDDVVGGFEIVLDDMDDLSLFNEYLYAEHLPPNLYSETLKQKAPEIFGWLEMQNINEYVIIILMIIVALINMITVLLILILERTKMIGTLKSLGATNWSIRKIFLYKATRIIIFSLVIGNIIGIGLCLFQKITKIVHLKEEDYYLSYVPIKLDYLWIIGLNMATVLVILFFLILPTYLISKIDPVKALRFK